jgi:hypothetical protein
MFGLIFRPCPIKYGAALTGVEESDHAIYCREVPEVRGTKQVKAINT